MQIVSPPPPPLVVHQRRAPPSKRYTIHKQEQIFTIDTKILSFKKENDAFAFSKLIEGHFTLTREWPMINYHEICHYKNIDSLKHINLVEWDLDALKMYCNLYIFDMLDIDYIEDGFRLKGSLIRWDIPLEFQVEYLTRVLQQSH